MVIISFRERQERIKARADERRAGQLTEAVAAASLYGLRLRGEDLAHALRDCAPPPCRTAEEDRYEASLAWMRDYLLGVH